MADQPTPTAGPDPETHENQEITELRAEHRRLDDLVDEMGARPWLTPDDQVELARLKRLRLATKDRLFRLLAEQDH